MNPIENNNQTQLANHLIPVEETKEPIEFANEQLKIFWLPDEIKVEKDIQDILVNFSDAERHGVITTLKLFSLYETHAGSEWWAGRFTKIFDGAEFHRMASVFSMFELAIHAPFYNRINQLLHLDNKEFYLSYQQDAAMSDRMNHIDSMINAKDDLVALAAFSMVEGVILYSSFAYLLHYQAQGNNKIMNINRGLLFSVKDENLHSTAGAWSFQYKKSKDNLSGEQEIVLENKIREIARTIYEHEVALIAKIFEKGPIKSITALQLERFVQSRINECLSKLGYAKEYDVKSNVISEWFYKSINNYSFNDVFSGVGSSYHRAWDEEAFDF